MVGNNSNTTDEKKIQVVIFVQDTEFSRMEKRMRENLDSLVKLGTIEIKLVERAGDKLVDILHKSNAWSDIDCNRNDCLICNTDGVEKVHEQRGMYFMKLFL